MEKEHLCHDTALEEARKFGQTGRNAMPLPEKLAEKVSSIW